MVDDTDSQRQANLIIALNILTGTLNPKEWRGLRSVDEDDMAVLNIFSEIRQWGYGKMEVNVIASKIETAYKSLSYRRKDLIKAQQGT